jgi:hypothetical protein
MIMSLPVFKPTAEEREWVKKDRDTALLIRSLWEAASGPQRRDPKFLWLLVTLGWTNETENGGYESTRSWRNDNLADYLDVDYKTDLSLAEALSRKFPKLARSQAIRLVATYTGITGFFKPLRPNTHRYVLRNASKLSTLFIMVNSRKLSPQDRIRTVADQLAKMPMFSTPSGGTASPFNPLSPVLACLDPDRRFPIINKRTHELLRSIGKDRDGDGAIALYNLIGTHGIHDSFELDVYSQVEGDNFPDSPRRSVVKLSRERGGRHKSVPIPIKSELASFASLTARRVRIHKEHNKLTNKFRQAIFANITPEESRYDLLIDAGWKKGRKLLIEAKTESEGSTGRMQIRQAIGQLFDYRFRYFNQELKSVDLAVLVPKEPSLDIKELLKSLKIAVIWFRGRHLCSTIKLPW